ncbi:MAG: HNH endonuclease [Firmicutes bacterium]|nr:HNH endonuclease [Bacillota bacterium]
MRTPLIERVPVRDLKGRPLTPCSVEKALENVRTGLARWDPDGVLHLNYQPLAHRRIYRQVQRRDGYVCAWCGGPGSTLDHVIPVCWGGETSLENCVIACRACNHSRNNALPSAFVEWTGYRPRHPILRRVLAHEAEYVARAQERLKTRPLSSCLSREEAQIWVAYHLPEAEREIPPPTLAPLTRIKPDMSPFGEYFVP